MHPLLHIAASKPSLLAPHLEGYAALLGAEFGMAREAWQRRALLHVLALCAALIAAALCGVAVMLWAVIPEAQMRWPLALLLTPMLPLLAAAACVWAAASRPDAAPFVAFRQQLQADLALWQEANP